jgi:hypothetical protein
VKRLAVIAVVVLLAGTALLVRQGGATAQAPASHACPLVPTLNGFKRARAIRSFTHDVSCAEALAIVRAMVSNVGVTFVGNPEGAAYQFRWKLYGFPGWTCYGDGSGFPEGGAGGHCSKGGATVEWWHAN